LPVHHEAEVHHEAHEATKRHKDWHHGGHRGHREGPGVVHRKVKDRSLTTKLTKPGRRARAVYRKPGNQKV
jgi:hypothetical protein